MTNISVVMFFIILMVGVILFTLSIFFIENESNEISETAFECGYEPFFMPRIPFSVHFFTVTVIFLIFDLEVVVLMPILFKLSSLWSLSSLTLMVWLLMGGLLVEWFDSSISWQL